jgi:tetratricopeptide (TPR) repeat protein
MAVNWINRLLGRGAPEEANKARYDAADALLAQARESERAGRIEEAIALFEKLLEMQPEHIEALLFVANSAYALKQYERALRHTFVLHEMDPDSAEYLARCAACEHALGNHARARELGLLALERRTEMYDVHWMLSQIDMPGQGYRDVLKRLHQTLRPRSYVEIGVFRGETLALAEPDTRIVGVDPAPQIKAPLPPLAQVHAETSDDFFAHHDLRAELGGLPVDLAFIDGMHRFEFALRDFMHLEALCAPESVILVHDCYPLNEATATRDQLTTFWSGDVWRLIVLLKQHRPDLTVRTIAAMPTGLGIITGLNPQSRYIAENLERMTAQGLAMDYRFLERDKAVELNRCDNDWARIATLLPRAFAQSSA